MVFAKTNPHWSIGYCRDFSKCVLCVKQNMHGCVSFVARATKFCQGNYCNVKLNLFILNDLFKVAGTVISIDIACCYYSYGLRPCICVHIAPHQAGVPAYIAPGAHEHHLAPSAYMRVYIRPHKLLHS